MSHPFLSQVERGLARPSITSLEALAKALDSSPVELLAAAVFDLEDNEDEKASMLLRAGAGATSAFALGRARLLVDGRAGLMPLEFTADNVEFGDAFIHPEDEFIYVLMGSPEVDLGMEGVVTLRPGDSLYYRGGTPHRSRSSNGDIYRLLIIKQVFPNEDPASG